jgi:hypothetical protein
MCVKRHCGGSSEAASTLLVYRIGPSIELHQLVYRIGPRVEFDQLGTGIAPQFHQDFGFFAQEIRIRSNAGQLFKRILRVLWIHHRFTPSTGSWSGGPFREWVDEPLAAF